MKTKTSRIVNIRYKVKGLRFDAAVDCDWRLHAYSAEKDVTPIELYCLDRPEWDIRMMYHTERNDQQGVHNEGCILHSSVDFQAILKATRKWIKMQGL